jgi:hypothetical protein
MEEQLSFDFDNIICHWDYTLCRFVDSRTNEVISPSTSWSDILPAMYKGHYTLIKNYHWTDPGKKSITFVNLIIRLIACNSEAINRIVLPIAKEMGIKY